MRGERKKGAEGIPEKIMTANFANYMRNVN